MKDRSSRPFIPVRIAVMSVTDSRTEETDTSGKTLAERLTVAGHVLAEKCIVPDDIYRIRAVVSRWAGTHREPSWSCVTE